MIHLMPTHSDESPYASIVGVDPGTDTLGLSSIYFDPVTLRIEKSYALTLVGSKCRINEHLVNIHSHRFARLAALEENIVGFLLYHQPIAVVCESPFFNAKRPQAYGALTEATNMIRHAVWRYDQECELNMIDPPSVKRAVGAKGNADKKDMMKAVCALPDLRYIGLPLLSELDEHSIDALAVSYSKLSAYRL